MTTTTTLKIATGNYGLTTQLKEGGVRLGGHELEHAAVEPVVGMRRMVRGAEFDIAEMAFVTYLCARAAGKPVTAIPVFLTRGFHQRAAFVNVNAGINGPRDLEGRTVATVRGYTVTTGVWNRGILATHYGVDLDKITWSATDEEHVAEWPAPPNVNYDLMGKDLADLMVAGQVPAAVGDLRVESAAVRPLIPDAKAAGFDYFRKTGIYPINHTVVIKDELLQSEPGIAAELFGVFEASKAAYTARLQAGKDLTAADEAALEIGSVVGDPFPFGVEANLKALEALLDFAADQRITPSRYGIEELFAAGTLELG